MIVDNNFADDKTIVYEVLLLPLCSVVFEFVADSYSNFEIGSLSYVPLC